MPMKRPMSALMVCAMLLPLAGCYDDNDGPRDWS